MFFFPVARLSLAPPSLWWSELVNLLCLKIPPHAFMLFVDPALVIYNHPMYFQRWNWRRWSVNPQEFLAAHALASICSYFRIFRASSLTFLIPSKSHIFGEEHRWFRIATWRCAVAPGHPRHRQRQRPARRRATAVWFGNCSELWAGLRSVDMVSISLRWIYVQFFMLFPVVGRFIMI